MLATGPQLEAALAMYEGHAYITIGSSSKAQAVWLTSDVSGAWIGQTVAKHGWAPRLALAANGRASILYNMKDGLHSASQQANGKFVSESLSGSAGAYNTHFALGAGGGLAAWNTGTAKAPDVFLTGHSAEGWTTPVAVGTGSLVGLSWHAGVVGLALFKAGLVFSSNEGSTFSEQLLDANSSSDAALALSHGGQAYVVYTRSKSAGIWLLVGPA